MTVAYDSGLASLVDSKMGEIDVSANHFATSLAPFSELRQGSVLDRVRILRSNGYIGSLAERNRSKNLEFVARVLFALGVPANEPWIVGMKEHFPEMEYPPPEPRLSYEELRQSLE